MGDLSKVLGAKREIELQGKTYPIGELTMGDLADFEERAKKDIKEIKQEKLAYAKEVYGSGNIPADVFREIVAAPTQDDIDAHGETIGGAVYMLWCALHKADATITEVQVRELATIKDIPLVLEALDMKADDDSEKKATKPTTA